MTAVKNYRNITNMTTKRTVKDLLVREVVEKDFYPPNEQLLQRDDPQ